jgi:HAD superfamily hydrolase (TIGR01484 family)
MLQHIDALSPCLTFVVGLYMRYLALASDYDGTLAHDGVVTGDTIGALERLTHSGRKLILVTGRELRDLESVFPRLDLCERVVAENGALLYNPLTREKQILAERPPQSFLDDLTRRGITNMSVGDVIVATWRPHEFQIIDAIRDSGLELQIIFNKDAVMILPAGVNKMTGLRSALEELRLSPHNVIGIGDAENDHAFLQSCECSVAVANAIPALKEKSDFVTEAARGVGVVELIDRLLENDAAELERKLTRHSIVIGKASGDDVKLPAYGSNVLVCGQSGSGKSTIVMGLLERIIQKKYQVCLIDPEGDYENLEGCRTLGDPKRPPSLEHVTQVLDEPEAQVVVDLVGVAAGDRPAYFVSLMNEIQKCWLRTGRPHWLAIEEAHHVLPSEWALAPAQMPEELYNLLLITVHPEHVSPAALRKVNGLLVVGRQPHTVIEGFANAVQVAIPEVPMVDLARGEALFWPVHENRVVRLQPEPPRNEHHRHRRKYAEGQLEPERTFHFRGPEGKLDLRAQNLNIFVQLAEGIDDETWLFHLKRGDYSNWFRHAFQDSGLADEIESVEQDESSPDSRDRIKNAIQQRYTAPA